MRNFHGFSLLQFLGITAGVVLVVAIVSAALTPYLVRRGLRTPAGLRLINRVTEQVVDRIKRPITIMVLDEVIDVIRTGHYTRNISDAIVENHEELKALVAEKLDEVAGKGMIGKLPGYGAIVGQASDVTLGVLISMLSDPRMDEFVSDLLRNNLEQIRESVRAEQDEKMPGFRMPDRPGSGTPER